MNIPEQAFLARAYEAFNARDIDSALSLMSSNVAWPNGMEGGTVHGREAVREYWTRQWTLINPIVKPLKYENAGDGTITVTVHQAVKDMNGNVLLDRTVHHIYRLVNGLIESMEIKDTIE